jgi:hypothetical protein
MPKGRDKDQAMGRETPGRLGWGLWDLVMDISENCLRRRFGPAALQNA